MLLLLLHLLHRLLFSVCAENTCKLFKTKQTFLVNFLPLSVDLGHTLSRRRAPRQIQWHQVPPRPEN